MRCVLSEWVEAGIYKYVTTISTTKDPTIVALSLSMPCARSESPSGSGVPVMTQL